ncbi:MAG: hypothetical protein ACE5HP_08285 [Gemmatimonadota bacterium]
MSTYESVIVAGMVLWILVASGILVAVLRLVSLLRAVRRPLVQAGESLRDLEKRLSPLLRHAERAAEDVNYIVTSFRTDVDHVGHTVRNMADSSDRMVRMVEERVAEITGLLEVVQEEAEETFLTTASLLRGLRGGREAADAKRGRRVLRRRARS